MKVTAFRERFRNELGKIYGHVETESFFYLGAEHYLNVRRVDIALDPTMMLDPGELASMEHLITELKKEVPIQYILGTAHFFGLEFKVSPDVLIPRPETEELVQWILDDHKNANGRSRIADIGTGSGCIAISLAKKMDADVTGIDVSETALEIACENAARNDVSVSFVKCDILTGSPDGKFDVIVSNPPYVRIQEKSEIRKNVLKYEPHLALFVEDDDPLLFYRRISELAMDSLEENGSLYFEINQYLGPQTVDLLRNNFEEVVLKKDIYGNDRMIRARKPKF